MNLIESQGICDSVVSFILDRALTKSIVPVFRSTVKRPAPLVDNQSCEAKFAKLSASKSNLSQLQFELSLVTENLKFVSKERDHWRVVADGVRSEAETVLVKNHDLTMTNLELSRMVEEQSGVCVEMMVMLMEVIWCCTESSALDISFSLLNHFMEFSRRIILQVSEDGKLESVEKRKEKDLLIGIVGTLVNMSSNANCMKQMLDSEAMSSMLDTLVSLINNTNNQKMVHLIMMLAVNILSADFTLKDTCGNLSNQALETLGKVVSRWSKGDKTGSPLQAVVSRLESCLENKMLGGVEQ